MRRLAIAGFALAASAAFMTGGVQAQPLNFDSSVAQAASGAQVETVQFRRHRGGGGWHGPRRHYGGGHYRRGGWGGRGVGAGVAGLAAGAIIGGVIANQAQAQPYPVYGAPAYGGDAEAYCANRFKSWDPASGTYLGYDGLRHPCP